MNPLTGARKLSCLGVIFSEKQMFEFGKNFLLLYITGLERIWLFCYGEVSAVAAILYRLMIEYILKQD